MTSTDLVTTNGHSDRLPWEKRKDESAKAFAYYAMYRDLGPERSLAKVAQAIHETTTRKATVDSLRTLLGKYSRDYGWVDRCEAYDMELDRRRREALETEQIKAARAQATAGGHMLAKGLARIAGTDKVKAIDAGELDASDAVRMVEVGTRVQRLGLGMATDLVKGSLQLSPADFNRIVGGIIDAALDDLPQAKQPGFLSRVERIVGGA